MWTMGIDDIVEAFSDTNMNQQILFLIDDPADALCTSHISRVFSGLPDWIVTNLDPTSDMLMGLAAKLYKVCPNLIVGAKLDLSYLGIGPHIPDGKPVFDCGAAIRELLFLLAQQGKRVLVIVENIILNDHTRVFLSEYQIFVRRDLPLFLLAEGTDANIRSIQDWKTLTFLHRVPKVKLTK